MSSRGRGRGRGRGKNPRAEQQAVKFPLEPSKPEKEVQGKPISAEQFAAAPSSTSVANGRRKCERNVENIQTEKLTSGEVTKGVEIAQHYSSKELTKFSKFAKRPGYGTLGRDINLVTNFFALQSKARYIYHYDIEVNSLDQIKKYGRQMKAKELTAAEAAISGISRLELQQSRSIGKMKRKEVFEELVKSMSLSKYSPVYDGVKNIFTSLPFPFDTQMTAVVALKVEGKTRQYEVIVKPVKKLNGSNAIDVTSLQKLYEGHSESVEEVLMAFNAVMNHREPQSMQVQVGRSFFFLTQVDKVALGEGTEIWMGYNQSVHLTEKGPALVLNLAAKAFHKAGPVIDYINEVLKRDITRGDAMKPHEIKKAENALKGVRVTVTHLSYPRKYHIQGISKVSARELQLLVDGAKMSIANYFQTKYGNLRYPFLPCLYMRSTNNQTYIPFEKCEVVEGQPKLGKLSAGLNSKMIKQAAVAPEARFKAIQKDAHIVNEQSGKQMQHFNLSMDLRPLRVQGRVLDPPSLAYFNKHTSLPDEKGIWRMEGKQFFKSSLEKKKDLKPWIILSFADCSLKDLERFANTFFRVGEKVGLHFGELLDIRIFSRRDTVEKALKDAEKTQASFAVIILSKYDYFHNYDEIKFIADYKLGFVTQCMDSGVVPRFNEQIATNVCLKINAKLGGVNHILFKRPEIFLKPVIVFGADVVHSPRGSGCPSIAAVVGSLDAYPSTYQLACRVQDNPEGNKISQELILKLREMVAGILKTFFHHTRGKYPEKIIFFRDGVSEGQFEAVRDHEVCEVERACKDIIGYIVPMTYIIVQKRHQKRLKPANPQDGIGRGRNVPAGTTVDRDITHPYLFDFYLNSHEGIQGTSKPAHYTVLYDTNNFTADDLQTLAYHLCYMYVRCNRSVSIPAPVRYADLAAYRAKKYADFHIQKERESSSSSNGSISKLPDYAREA
ncbi:Protein argonaute-2, partial [Stegodyphus mimosarum]